MIDGFQAEKVRDSVIEEIRNKSRKDGWSKVVIGISGGKDSSVAAALCARALGKEHVYGVLMPDHLQKDLEDSIRVVKSLGIQYKIVNIGAVHDALLGCVTASRERDQDGGEFKVAYHRESNVNIPPRIRMTVLRYIGQSMGALLCGTGNLSESTVGYCTKDGDTSCDFNPIGALTSLEVVEVGLTMKELPPKLVQKIPDDGLSGMPDEEKLGVTYKDIHNYIRNGGDAKDTETNRRIGAMKASSDHKRKLPQKLLCGEDGTLLPEFEPFFFLNIF